MATLITLSFDVEKLLRIVQIRSLYTANSMRGQVGETQERNYALTDNEQDFFEISLKTASDQVFNALQAYTTDVTDPYTYNYLDTVTSRRFVIYKINVPDNYNQANIRGLYNVIESAITGYILREWFLTLGLGAVAQIYDNQYRTGYDQIKSNINYRTTRITRPHTTL